MTCRLCWATPLLAKVGGETIGEMAKDTLFELLELAGGHGWGVAAGAGPLGGRVGYVDRRALELA